LKLKNNYEYYGVTATRLTTYVHLRSCNNSGNYLFTTDTK